MYAYYNDSDPFAAAWLRELIADKLIPDGEVDERSITDVEPRDLAGFIQCHFFCGIGGWPLALQLAGWPADRPVWTGSCPCQPFSLAGKGQGAKDARHLWPQFFRLIQKQEPSTVFGEQVASSDGRDWLAGVRADLEVLGYAVGCADLCAASVSAPHIRQRLWWVAERRVAEDAHCLGRGGRGYGDSPRDDGQVQVAGLGTHGGMAESAVQGPQGQARPRQRTDSQLQAAERGCDVRGVADAELRRLEQCHQGEWAVSEPDEDGDGNFWSDSIWHPCRDGKSRRIPTQSALFPLASRLSNRVGILRGAGNSIVAQVGAEFIKAYMEASQCAK